MLTCNSRRVDISPYSKEPNDSWMLRRVRNHDCTKVTVKLTRDRQRRQDVSGDAAELLTKTPKESNNRNEMKQLANRITPTIRSRFHRPYEMRFENIPVSTYPAVRHGCPSHRWMSHQPERITCCQKGIHAIDIPRGHRHLLISLRYFVFLSVQRMLCTCSLFCGRCIMQFVSRSILDSGPFVIPRRYCGFCPARLSSILCGWWQRAVLTTRAIT